MRFDWFRNLSKKAYAFAKSTTGGVQSPTIKTSEARPADIRLEHQWMYVFVAMRMQTADSRNYVKSASRAAFVQLAIMEQMRSTSVWATRMGTHGGARAHKQVQ